jgi:ubiquinone/menaquinone biosynthesis C-methylase UbiE
LTGHNSRNEEALDQPVYEYYGMLAATWDLFRGDTSNWPDKLFYRDIIQKYGQPVLDVGCGTGRLVLDYLQEGLDVDGVDNSPEMLAICRQKAQKRGLQPALYEQWMETLDLPRLYRTILGPSSTFQLLPDLAVAEKALGNLYRHLEPGGVLVMSFMPLWSEDMPLQTDWFQIGEIVRPEDGALIRRWGRERNNPEKKLTELSEERYDVIVNGQVIASEYHQRPNSGRWYTQGQAVALYQAAGFKHIQKFDDFTFQPATEKSVVFCVLGQK